MNKKHLVFIISMMLIVGGLASMFLISHINRHYIIYYISFKSEADNVELSGMLYIPNPRPNASNPVPGVVVCHGFASSKIAMQTYSLELAIRGFVVLSFDFRGHGDSEGLLNDLTYTNESPLIGDCYAAVKVLQGLKFVDNKSIALIGHSMGGFTSMQTSAIYSDEINMTIAISAILLGRFQSRDYINTSAISNLMLGLGENDELFSVELALQFLSNITNGVGSQINTLYGNFSKGNATELVVSQNADHLTIIYDMSIIESVIIWLETAFFGGLRSPILLSTPFHTASIIVAFIGITMGFFPIISLTRESVFKGKSRTVDKENVADSYNLKLVNSKWEQLKGVIYYGSFYIGGMGLGLLFQVPLNLLLASAIPKVMSNIILGIFVGMALGLLIMYVLLKRLVENDPNSLVQIVHKRTKEDFKKMLIMGFVIFFYTAVSLILFLTFSVFDMLPTLRDLVVIFEIMPFTLAFVFIDEIFIRQLQDKLQIHSHLKEWGLITVIGALFKLSFFIPAIFLATGLTLMLIEPLVIFIILIQAISTWMYINFRRNITVPLIITGLLLSWAITMLMPFGYMYFQIF